MAELRPYQQDARQRINAAVNAGRNPVYCAPTGTGKTKTAVSVIADRARLKERIFILTPQVEIFNQWLIEFSKNPDTAEITGHINDTGVQGRNKKIYVVMPLSLINLLPYLPESFKPDIIVTDEAHRSEAQTWQAIYSAWPTARRVGLTATPERTDGMGLDNTYDSIIQTITMSEAIDAGYLCKPLIIVPEEYKLKVPVQNGEFDPQAQAEQLGRPQIIGDVIRQYGHIFNGLPVMVACSTHEHAEQMTQAFCDAGWAFEHIHSGLHSRERAGILQRIRTGKTHGVCTVGIGVEGLDIPGLFGLIWLRRTMSLTIYLQFIGRVLRPAPEQGKQYGIIVDPVGNVFIHGRPEMPRKWSLQGRIGRREIDPDECAPKMKICPVCGVMNAEQNITCHICEHDFRDPAPEGTHGRRWPRMVDGELVFLDEIPETEPAPGPASGAQTAGPRQAEPIIAPALSKAEKMALLKNGLEKRRGVFAETVKNFL